MDQQTPAPNATSHVRQISSSLGWNGCLPVAIVTCRVKNSENDDGAMPAEKENAIRETFAENPPHFRLVPHARILPGIMRCVREGFIDLGEEFLSKPWLLVLIPDCSVADVEFRLDTDDEATLHEFSLA
jgi:hypothetical protein